MTTPRLPDDLELHYVDTYDEAEKLMEWFRNDRNRSCIAVDSETGGLDFHHDDLRLVQVGDTQAGFAIPWHRWGGLFTEIVNKWDGPLVAHNLAFDMKFFEREKAFDIDWSQWHDTMIMAKIMRPGRNAGLKPLSVQFVDPRADAGQAMLKKAMADNNWGWDTVPLDLPVYNMYGALDTVETAYLFDLFRADLKFPEVYDMEMAYLRCAYNMEKRGFRVDVDYAAQKKEDLYAFVENSRTWAKDNLGISIGSGPQLIKFFQGLDEELMARHAVHAAKYSAAGQTPECDALCDGVQITETTNSGQPSMNAEQLKLFLNHPDPRVQKVAKLTYDARKAEKLATTYFKALVEKNVDGRIHPSINTLGAITGRNSVSNPNLQNLPSNSSVVKNAFVPEEGHLLLSSDLDQVELRLTACLSEDQGLIGLFHSVANEGGDIFTKLGQELYEDPSMAKGDPRRALVKTFMYASLYGASIRKQALSANVPVETMQEFADKFAEKYPGLGQFQQRTIDLVNYRHRNEGEGYITTPTTGRRIPVEPDKAYKGTNYTIQSVAADIMKKNVIALDAAGLGDALRIPVHDEIIVDVDPSDMAEAKHTIVECMTTTEGWAVPLTADCSDGLKRWGQKYEEDH
jgi:DNA polymerase-1